MRKARIHLHFGGDHRRLAKPENAAADDTLFVISAGDDGNWTAA